MLPYAGPNKRYQKTDIITSDPLRLVVLLYEGILKHIGAAIQSIKTINIEAKVEHINRALSMIAELQATLNHEKGGEIAKNLDRLYTYWRRRLVDANLQNSASPLEEVQRLVKELWSAWDQVASRNQPRDAMMTRLPSQGSIATVFRA